MQSGQEEKCSPACKIKGTNSKLLAIWLLSVWLPSKVQRKQSQLLSHPVTSSMEKMLFVSQGYAFLHCVLSSCPHRLFSIFIIPVSITLHPEARVACAQTLYSLVLRFLRQTSFPAPFCGTSHDDAKCAVMHSSMNGPAGKAPTLAPFHHKLL